MIAACSKTGGDAVRPTERPAIEETPQRKQGAAPSAATGPAPHEDESEQHEELPTKVRLPRQVVRAAGIKTAPAMLDSLPATVDLTGEIAADPDRSAQLAARVPGRIVDVRVKEGDRVKAGQTVAVLDSPDLARARAILRASKQSLSRPDRKSRRQKPRAPRSTPRPPPPARHSRRSANPRSKPRDEAHG